MRNKKAVELSINFMVMLILAITIFGFGVRFAYQLTTSANELKDLTVGDIDQQISDLLCGAADRVCLSNDREVLNRGDVKVFGVSILNVQAQQDYEVTLTESPNIGYKKDNTQLTTSLIIKPNVPRTVNIAKNDKQSVGFGVEVPKSAQSGTYILDVRVRYTDPVDGQMDYTPVQKIYVEVP